MKKLELRQLIREEVKKVIKETKITPEAAYIHQITDSGQEAAQNFIDDNNIDGKKLADYVKQHRNTKEKYNIRDIIAGTGVKTDTFVKKLLKEDGEHYMFFENLKIIKKAVDEMLNLDKQMVDDILSDGHDWAEDHMATSKDDVEEVYNFLIHKKVPTGLEEKKQLSSKQKKIASAASPEDEITGADFAALQANKKK